ncbi:biopolymer transporter ExbD [Flavobacterium sp. F372]|uniref:Biopolymer transporter ExbD n=1 Tax=Flavobacterium bernardetii TaxID=2813823 RepID=A0ABR7J213_9FLAO|nr:biopolymer transporter ExbD [Flavobacterium bernardetii]MBC5836060.1 biopolymer transporter ExbD [Flavobacterium bernardetii]NHF71200.1 biopolymer transporter ExbD [Flavobacterium bernardetii]
MAIKRNRRFHAEVHASSMSDIMFFLLLFFLIISTLANPNVIKLNLPKSKTNEKTNKQLITISVTGEVDSKTFFIDKQQVSYENLEKDLLIKVGDNKEATVVIRMPYNFQVQDLVDVMQIGVKNNIKFVLATNAKN